jgi:hypothetical protein
MMRGLYPAMLLRKPNDARHSDSIPPEAGMSFPVACSRSGSISTRFRVWFHSDVCVDMAAAEYRPKGYC